MSTIVFKNGLRIYVNPKEREHRGRPHCHVEKGDAKASIDFQSGEVLINNGKFSSGDMKTIVEMIALLKTELMSKWEEYHGKQEDD